MGGEIGINEIKDIIIENLPIWTEWQKNKNYVEKNWEKIQEMYGGKHIGVLNEGEIIISNDDMIKSWDEIEKICKTLDKDPREVYYKRVKGKNEIWIFPVYS